MRALSLIITMDISASFVQRMLDSLGRMESASSMSIRAEKEEWREPNVVNTKGWKSTPLHGASLIVPMEAGAEVEEMIDDFIMHCIAASYY